MPNFSFASFVRYFSMIPLLILQQTVKFSQCSQTHQEINPFNFSSRAFCPPALTSAAFLLAFINPCHLGNCLQLFSVLYYTDSFIHFFVFITTFSFWYSIYSHSFVRKGANKVHTYFPSLNIWLGTKFLIRNNFSQILK